MNIGWECLRFEELTTAALYTVLRARQDVFILEQQCFYNDFDGYDEGALHLLGWSDEGHLLAYLRIIAPGVKFPEYSLGRVLSTKAGRGNGAGRALLAEALRRTDLLYPGQRCRIGAQRYLEAFYTSFGFQKLGEPYVEDGIAHLDMLR